MKITFTKAAGFEAERDSYPEGVDRVELHIDGPVTLSYGSLCVTLDQQVDAIGGHTYRAGEAIAEYDSFDGVWTLAGGTHWSDLLIEP